MASMSLSSWGKEVILGAVVILFALICIGLVKGVAFSIACAFLLLCCWFYGALVVSLWESQSPFAKLAAAVLMCNLLPLLFFPKSLKEQLHRLKEVKPHA